MPRSPTLFLLVTLAAGLVLLGCEEEPDDAPHTAEPEAVEFSDDGTLHFVRDADTLSTIDIEIADTDEARERGLMGREELPDMSGMLFVFPDEDDRGFWMADTPLALDLIFADSAGDIVNIHKYARPHAAETIESEGPAQYVVEVPAGFADRHGIMDTDAIDWNRN